jgi:hypothetical protein
MKTASANDVRREAAKIINRYATPYYAHDTDAARAVTEAKHAKLWAGKNHDRAVEHLLTAERCARASDC